MTIAADDIMVDIETLGTSDDAHIISIGACHMWYPDFRFYRVIKMENQGRKIDADTVRWWMTQSDEARGVFTNTNAGHLTDVLLEFEAWIAATVDPDKIQIWSHGDDFDTVILKNAYQTGLRKDPPWEFWNTRDTRTLIDFHTRRFGHPGKPDRKGTHHNALDDALFQAEWMRNIFSNFAQLMVQGDSPEYP